MNLEPRIARQLFGDLTDAEMNELDLVITTDRLRAKSLIRFMRDELRAERARRRRGIRSEVNPLIGDGWDARDLQLAVGACAVWPAKFRFQSDNLNRLCAACVSAIAVKATTMLIEAR